MGYLSALAIVASGSEKNVVQRVRMMSAKLLSKLTFSITDMFVDVRGVEQTAWIDSVSMFCM